jgi:hypothetical protein
MISSKETPSTRDILKDEFLNFNCYQFSRGIKAGRPASSREVSAEQCVCTRDTSKICDPSQLYSLCFFETSDEQEAENQKRLSKYPDIPPDRIGVFDPDGKTSFIYVPPDFLEALWTAAIAADGVLRSIQLKVQPQKGGTGQYSRLHYTRGSRKLSSYPLISVHDRKSARQGPTL